MSKLPCPIKRLFWDTEVSHNVVLAFRAGYDQVINPESIIRERKIICIAWRWEGEDRAHVLTWDLKQDDKRMLKEFLVIANGADELVAHNGDRYDNPMFRTRCVINGLEPIPPWKTVDTCAWARKYYEFNSNKLSYLATVLGLKGKTETDRELWHDVLVKNCRKSLARMASYCKDDVDVVESIYHKLKFCVKPKTHAGVARGLDKWTDPRNGSDNVIKNKTRITAGGIVQHQFQCLDDGSYYTISNQAYQAYLTMKKKKKKGTRY